MGDFNVPPADLAGTFVLHRLEAIVSKQWKSLASIEANWEAPCKPHCMIAARVQMDAMEKSVLQLQKFPAIPKLHQPQWTWDQCSYPVRDVQFLRMGLGPLRSSMPAGHKTQKSTSCR